MKPVIILEKESTTGTTPLTADDLNHFSIARTPRQLKQRSKKFKQPVFTSADPIVNEALKIESLFNQ